ncbi:hypothetical protein HELRODRAFT_193141 [Helobdella robusta]|uniref:Uncharacterized protein n=1 Tax=Helobdella robusta TaxID=6412 RepID=T1FUN5_HELRO|nr:hypothetical protein HELRODRAFT_193141 [Helobdella robusta]ESN97913.1 hypothetical protein HELRODRAFT_193141 [Helobdella robusta]
MEIYEKRKEHDQLDEQHRTKLLALPRIIQLVETRDSEVSLKINYENRSKFPPNANDAERWSYLTLNYAKFGQLERCVEFIKDAIREGDNVGSDEFKDDDKLMNVLSLSEIFILNSANKNDNDVRAFVVIQPWLTSRTIDTCLASILVYYDQNWMKSGFNHFPRIVYMKDEVRMALLDLGIQLTKEIQIGYTDCVLRVCPASNLNLLKTMCRYGFKVAVNIPDGVLIKNQLEKDCIVVKQFDQLRKPRSDEDVREMINRVYNKEKCDRIFESSPLRTVSFLPRFYKIDNENVLFIRNATKEDAFAMYNLLLQASKDGRGYGTNEFPTFHAFKIWMLNYYSIIYDHVDCQQAPIQSDLLKKCTFEMVGCSFITESCHLRTSARQAAESSVVVSSKFRGRGLGKRILHIEMGLMKELNYKIMINDILTSNSQMKATLSGILREDDYVHLGSLQNVSYTQGCGWDSQEIRYYDLQKPSVKSFTNLLNENRQQFNLSSKL